MAGVAPLNVKVVIAVDTENPEPVTVIDMPVGPCVWERVIVGVVMVKVVDAVSGLPSLPVATTVYPPAASEGTVKVHEKVPVAEVV